MIEVIMLKKYKNWEKNEIVKVKPGFAKNFLFKNQIAVPANSFFLKKLEKEIKKFQEEEKIKIQNAKKLKEKIEKLLLTFYLKKGEKNTTHGSVTKKQIKEELLKNDIKLPSHSISKFKIKSFDTFLIKIVLHKNVIANLKIEVKKDEK